MIASIKPIKIQCLKSTKLREHVYKTLGYIISEISDVPASDDQEILNFPPLYWLFETGASVSSHNIIVYSPMSPPYLITTKLDQTRITMDLLLLEYYTRYIFSNKVNLQQAKIKIPFIHHLYLSPPLLHGGLIDQ